MFVFLGFWNAARLVLYVKQASTTSGMWAGCVNKVIHTSTKCYAVWYEHLSDMLRTTLEISVTQLRPVTEIAPKSPFLCVNRSPIQYGFPAGAKAIQCSNEFYIVFFTGYA